VLSNVTPPRRPSRYPRRSPSPLRAVPGYAAPAQRVSRPFVRRHRCQAHVQRPAHVEALPVLPEPALPVEKPVLLRPHVAWVVLHVGRVHWSIRTCGHEYLDRLAFVSKGSLVMRCSHLSISRGLAVPERLGKFRMSCLPLIECIGRDTELLSNFYVRQAEEREFVGAWAIGGFVDAGPASSAFLLEFIGSYVLFRVS